MDSEIANRILAEKLFAAIRRQQTEDVEKYLCLGADPNYIVLNGHSPFHIAAGCQQSEHFIKLMLKYDGNPNVRNDDGLTPLHIATSWGKTNSMKLLAENGANVHIKGSDNRDLKWFAEENGSPECIRYAECLLSNDHLVQTPKSSKTFGRVKHVEDKENRNTNSASNDSKKFDIRSPLNGACDDSWIVKNRGSSKKHWKNPPVPISPIGSQNYMVEHLHKTPTGSCTAFERCMVHHMPCGIVYSPISCCSCSHGAHSLTRSKTVMFDTPDRRPAEVKVQCEKTHKSVGMSLNCETKSHCRQFNPDTTNKCIGTSVLTEDSMENDEVFEEARPVEDKCVGVSILDDEAGKVGKDGENNCRQKDVISVDGNSKGNSTSCNDCQAISSPVRTDRISVESAVRSSVEGDLNECDQLVKKDDEKCHAFSPIHCRSLGDGTLDMLDVTSDETVEILDPCESQSATADIVNSPAPTRDMLLSTKAPLSKSEQAQLYGEKFLCTMKEDANPPDHADNQVPTCDILIAKSFGMSQPSVETSPHDPDGEKHSSISLRRFAAMSLSEGKESEYHSTGKAARDRLHSTVVSQSSSGPDIGDETSWDISIIKDASPLSKIPPLSQKSSTESNYTQRNASDSYFQQSDSTSQSTIIYNWRSYWKGETIPKSANAKRSRKKSEKKRGDSDNANSTSQQTTPKSTILENLTNSQIRDRLLALGVQPGPIGANREFYRKKLEALLNTQERQDTGTSTQSDVDAPKFSTELNRYVSGGPFPDSVVADDEIVRHQFEQPDPNLSWREGTTKNSFTYLLLDPRVTNHLPVRAKFLAEDEVFKAFTGAIFYIGKGKQCRPFHHFTEALQAKHKLHPSQKVQHILSIWDADLGVISLHVYQSIIACEAYTREAAMIDALGLGHLTNCRRGDYYGKASSWDLSRKCRYGSYLVKKALEVLMVEGERQIKPINLTSKKKKKKRQDYVPP